MSQLVYTSKCPKPIQRRWEWRCLFLAYSLQLREKSSIIVGIKEDEDVTFLNPRVPLEPPAAVIGKSADVKEVMRAQLAINPSLP